MLVFFSGIDYGCGFPGFSPEDKARLVKAMHDGCIPIVVVGRDHADKTCSGDYLANKTFSSDSRCYILPFDAVHDLLLKMDSKVAMRPVECQAPRASSQGQQRTTQVKSVVCQPSIPSESVCCISFVKVRSLVAVVSCLDEEIHENDEEIHQKGEEVLSGQQKLTEQPEVKFVVAPLHHPAMLVREVCDL